MPLYYHSEIITGVANQRTYGDGLTSTEAEKKRIKKVIVTTSARQGNYLEFWVEREKRGLIVDYNLPLATDTFRYPLEFDFELETGRTFKPALVCGGTATNVYITYVYEIVA